MSIFTYIRRRIKGLAVTAIRAGKQYPEIRSVQCHRCHQSIMVREGRERTDLGHHFDSKRHR